MIHTKSLYVYNYKRETTAGSTFHSLNIYTRNGGVNDFFSDKEIMHQYFLQRKHSHHPLTSNI